MVSCRRTHLYQRLTYRYADGWELPLLIAGSEGHARVEPLFAACDGSTAPARSVPFDAVSPAGFALPDGDSYDYGDSMTPAIQRQVSSAMSSEPVVLTNRPCTCSMPVTSTTAARRISIGTLFCAGIR